MAAWSRAPTSSTSSTKATRRSSPNATPPRAPTSSSSSTSRLRPNAARTLLDIVERTARRAFIPLTVGGGVRTVDEMRDVLRAGADKVSLNTAAVADPTLVARCAGRFGRQAVVVAIDARATRAGPRPALGGRRQGRPRGDRARRGGLGGAGRGRRRRRAAGHVDRSRRDRRRLRHGAAARDHFARRCPGHRLGGRRPPGRSSWPRSVTGAPMRCSRHRSSIAASTRSPTSRPRWRPPGSRSASCRSVAWRRSTRPGRPRRPVRPRRARAGGRPGRRRRSGAHGRLDGRRGAGGHHGDRRGPLPLPVAGAALAQGRDERQRPAAGRSRRSIATATRCWSPPIRPARPVIAGRAAASTPTTRRPDARPRGSPGSRRSGRRSPTAKRPDPAAHTRPRCSTVASTPSAERSPKRRPRS